MIGCMPKRVDLAGMPVRAAAAHEAVSGHARLGVLRYLLDHPGSKRPEIVSGTGVSAGGVRAALAELESLGYVVGDIDAPRRGQRVRYTASRHALTDDLTALVAWILR